jgi:hypothetical protein
MTDTTEIAARYGVPTPEELVAEYEKRGMRWTGNDFYRDDGDDGECCCAVGMLTLIETSDPAVLPDLTQGAAWEYLDHLPREFINGTIAGNDGDRRPPSSWWPGYVDGWEYGHAVRLAEVTHD